MGLIRVFVLSSIVDFKEAVITLMLYRTLCVYVCVCACMYVCGVCS